MAVKIRLRKQGRHNTPFFRIVVTDARTKRDGRYIESLGWYNPRADKPEDNLKLDAEQLLHWVGKGAIMSERVEALFARGAAETYRAWKQKSA